MSTRSCIARKEGDGWRGVYHHSNGYPSGLGCYIFRLIRQKYQRDVAAFLKWAIDEHDGGWSHIYPGDVVRNAKGGGSFFDKKRPQPQCYCHGYFAKRDGISPGKGDGIQSNENHAFGLEWVYVLDPDSKTMAIFEHGGQGCPDYARIRIPSPPGQGPCTKLKAVVHLDDPEPDWWEMEAEHFVPEHLERRQTWVDRYLPPVREGVAHATK